VLAMNPQDLNDTLMEARRLVVTDGLIEKLTCMFTCDNSELRLIIIFSSLRITKPEMQSKIAIRRSG
jgi:hypothetical protein